MNKDIFEGNWKQIRGEAKAWWGKLTDNDLDRAAGKFGAQGAAGDGALRAEGRQDGDG